MEVVRTNKSYTAIDSYRLILRIQFGNSQTSFAGCDPKSDALKLMMEAKVLDLNLCGISFDNDSSTFDTEDYKSMLITTRSLFDYGKGILGLDLDTICIGGGIPATIDPDTFSHFGAVISKIITEFFPEPSITVIAEPGEFLVGPSMTLFCTVQARKEILNADGDVQQMIYYLNHSFTGGAPNQWNTKWLESESQEDNKFCNSIILGQTSEKTDIVESKAVPIQFVGDVLYFENVGANLLNKNSNYGGFRQPIVKYYLKESCKIIL